MTEKIDTHSSDLRSVLTFRLARLNNHLNAQAISLLKKHSDLSLMQWRVISTTHMLGETTMTRLGKWSQVDKGQLSRTTKNLIEKKYLQAAVSENDARQQNLSLSKKGQSAYQQLLPIMRQRQESLVQGISKHDLLIFNQVIDQLNANIQTMKQATHRGQT